MSEEHATSVTSLHEVPISLVHDDPKDGWCTFRLMIGDREVGRCDHRPELPYMAFQQIIREIVEPYPSDD